MRENSNKFSLETKSGETVTVGDVSVTPQSQSLTMRWPQGGWVFNRPSGLVVQRGEETELIPILDVTRIAQAAFYGISALCALIGFVWMIRKKEK